MCALRTLMFLALASCASEHTERFDAGVACVWSAPPSPMLFDMPCTHWATQLARQGAAITRYAPSPNGRDAAPLAHFRCASADRCVSSLCYCGAEPECATGRACMLVGAQPRCVECTR